MLVTGIFLGISLIVIFMVFSNINTNIQNSSEFNQEAKEPMETWTNSYTTVYDAVFILVYIGFGIAGLIFVALLDTTPIFYFLVWIADMILLYVSALLANSYAAFQSNPAVQPFAQQFEGIQFVMSNFLELTIVWAALYTVVFFIQTRRTAFA
jgi:Na+/melibiose symporter-like transporter